MIANSCAVSVYVMLANKFVFLHPVRCVLSGPSGSGKTEFIKKVIAHKKELFSTEPKRVVFAYKYPEEWFHQFPMTEFVDKVPKAVEFREPTIIVIDDLICDLDALKDCVHLFVRGSRHADTSVFFITQNLFAPFAPFRTILLNTNLFVLFQTLIGVDQIEHLGRRIFGKSKRKYFEEAYKDAASKEFSYLLVDLHPSQQYRLRTNIFPDETEVVYIPE